MSCRFVSGPPSRPPVPASKPRCSIGLPFSTTMLLIGSQNRWHKRDGPSSPYYCTIYGENQV